MFHTVNGNGIFWYWTDCNALWLSCRFHGSYEAVYGGWAGNAFTALTGGISEKMKTSSSDPDERLVSSDQLFRRLHNALTSSGAFVTATAVLPTTHVRCRQSHCCLVLLSCHRKLLNVARSSVFIKQRLIETFIFSFKFMIGRQQLHVSFSFLRQIHCS